MDLVVDKIRNPALTAEWEKALADIQHGSGSPAGFMNEITDFIRTFINDMKLLHTPEKAAELFDRGRESVGCCPKCGKQVVEWPKSYSCESGKDGCGFIIWKTVAGKTLTKAQVTKLLLKKKTDLIKGFSNKAGKKFDAYLVLKSDFTLGFEFPERK